MNDIETPWVIRVLSLDILMPSWELIGLEFSAGTKLIINKYAKDAYIKFLEGADEFYHASFSARHIGEITRHFSENVKRKIGKHGADSLRIWMRNFERVIKNRGGENSVKYALISKMYFNHSLKCQIGLAYDEVETIKNIFSSTVYKSYAEAESRFDEYLISVYDSLEGKLPCGWDCKVIKNYDQVDSIFAGLKELVIDNNYVNFEEELKNVIPASDIRRLESWVKCEASALGVSLA